MNIRLCIGRLLRVATLLSHQTLEAATRSLFTGTSALSQKPVYETLREREFGLGMENTLGNELLTMRASWKLEGLRAKGEPGLFKSRPSTSLSIHLAYG